MKKLITLMIIIYPFMGNAQVLGSLFSQKKENRKLLAQQIAAFQVYKGYLKQGYKIASTGLTTIQGFKSGEFGLHRSFFNSLKIVNPRIRKYAKVADIIAFNIKGIFYQRKIKALSRSGSFSMEQAKIIADVSNSLLLAFSNTLDDLIDVISDNRLELKDDERLSRIDTLYDEMKDHFSFTRSFLTDVSLWELQNKKQRDEIRGVSILQGISK